MFSRAVAAFFLVLPIFAAAQSNQCNTGPVQCCNQMQSSSNMSDFVKNYLSLAAVDVKSVTGQIGVTCSPLTGAGIGGNSCSSQPVCCSNNSFNGVVALGCSPINIGL